MLVSQIKEEDLTVEIIDRLLFQGLADIGEKADCIIVLGSRKAALYRVPVAVDAYKAGRARNILLCGGKVRDFPDGTYSEAEHMRQAALVLGIPEDAVIVENTSQNTVENILCALVELQRHLWLNRIRKVLLVTTAFHMRRSLAIARYLFPRHISVFPCPASDTHTRRDNWMLSPVGIERAKGEALNLVKFVTNGVIPDFEI